MRLGPCSTEALISSPDQLRIERPGVRVPTRPRLTAQPAVLLAPSCGPTPNASLALIGQSCLLLEALK